MVAASTALVLSVAQPAQAAPPAAAAPVAAAAAADAQDLPKTERPDAVSAQIQAKAIKAPVEVTGARTEASTTWALPSGGYRVDNAPGPVRVQQADGSWADTDYTLVHGKASFAPTNSPYDVKFSDGGEGVAAAFTFEGRTVTMTWPGGPLPAPTVSGATATYAVSPDQNLTLTATASGFEQSLVLTKRPAADDPAPVVTLPLNLAGLSTGAAVASVAKKQGKTLTLDATVTGGRDWTRGNPDSVVGPGGKPRKAKTVAAGDPVFAIQNAAMYSAATDPKTHRHTQVRVLTPTLADAPTSGVAAGADAAVEVKLGAAEKAFLDDPETVYPVTIDPTIAAATQYGDTYVNQGAPNVSHWGESFVAGGNFGGSDQNRALIGFSSSDAYMGEHVTSASLKLYNYYTDDSCTPHAVKVYPLTSGFDATTTWNTNGPAWRTDYSGSSSFAHGYSGSCPAASESIDVTSIVQAWAFYTVNDLGFLVDGDPGDGNQPKVFCSMDLGASPCDVVSHEPTLSVTYNTYPWAPESGSVTFSPQVAGTTGRVYSTSLQPTFSAKVNNSDGTPLRLEAEVSHDPAYPAEGSGVVWDGTGAAVAPLSVATVQVSSPLAGGHYQYRVRGAVTTGSGGTDIGDWSGYQIFQTNTSHPVAPTVSCASYGANTWTTSTGAAVSCSLSTTSVDGSGYYWGLDDPSVPTLQSNGTNNGQTQSISINPADGYHTLYARTRDTALQLSGLTTKYTFGVGKGGILTPGKNAQTSQSIGLTAQSTSSYTTFKYQYQAGTGGTTWTDVPIGNVYAVGSSSAITAWPTGTVSGSVTNYPQLNWNVAATLAAASKPEGAVQVRVVFNPSGTPWNSTATTFVLAKSAFAATAATSSLGPGTVSLVTGDFAVDETDASFGGLTIGRTNTNLAPPAASTGPSGVFGAGWTTAAFGPDAGVGMYTLNDNSAAGSVTLSDSTGTKATYTGVSTTAYTGIGDAADGSTLAKNTSTSTWQLKETDGTLTTWLQQGTTNTYNTSQVVEPGAEGTTLYSRDGAGRVTQIIGAPPTGVTCTSSSLVKGCRALVITYAASTTATGTTETTWGNYNGLVSSIGYTVWNPATSAMATTTVASYLYDNTGHLRGEWDPRISPALKTRYTYDGSGRLATQTDPGRATWTMGYDSNGRVSSVTRPDPNTGTSATQAVLYRLGLSGTGLPDVTSGTAAGWNQTTDVAYEGAAVFPASRVPAGSSGAWTPSAADWPYADLTYYDVNGRPVNTASYGAGAWLIDTTRYDDYGNTIWSLSARNRAQALTPTTGDGGTDPYTATQTTPAVRADLLSTTSTYTADGVDLLTVLGPAHPIYLASGTYSSVRVKTTNSYDQGSPGGAIYHLVTTTKVASVPLDGAATTASDTRTSTIGYDPIDGPPSSPTGDTSGWTQRTPTTSTAVMGTAPGTGDIIRKTLLDSSGRALESRMPESSAADAGTTVNVYYTTAANSTYTNCGNRPEWAGLLCQSGPKAQPTGTTIPTTTATYNMWDQPLTAVDASGGSTRTTTSGYDTAGRPTTVAITASPAADAGTAVPTITTSYNSTTGDPTSVTDGTTTISSVFNSIGQVTSYTDADSQATTSTYDIDGNVKTVNDGKGTYTYAYDGTDANGQTERRGLLTSLDVGITGSPSTFTAGYDADGNMTVQNYPGGIQQTQTYDNTDDARSMTYAKSGTTWMSFASGADRDGHTSWQASPGSYQSFGYDNNDRLTSVRDNAGGQCTTRQYAFNGNGNRTGLTTGAPATDGTCQTSTTSTTSTSYDAADRDTNTGYTYDKFGRTLTVPNADVTGGSQLSVGYFSNDMVGTQTQGSKTKTFTLDPGMRLRTAVDKTSGIETRRILNHYNDGGDTPSWINTSTNAGTSWTWQRSVAGIGGDLAILQNQTGTPQIQLANPHGDVIATVDDTTTATSTNAYFESTEYGIPRTSNTNNPARYGWLGAKQRSNDDLGGLTLMGVRLYNPQTGKFLSIDPVAGGNENGYAYPNDPVNGGDLDGRWGSWLKKHAGTIGTIAGIAGLVATGPVLGPLLGGIAIAASGYSAYQNYRAGNKKAAAWDALGVAVGVGAAVKTARAARLLRLRNEAQAAERNYRGAGAVRRAARVRHAKARNSAARWERSDKSLAIASGGHLVYSNRKAIAHCANPANYSCR